MENLIKQQRDELGLMSRAYVNLKKKGERSSKGQIQARMEHLQKRMTEIGKRHETILLSSTAEGDEENSYFKTNFLEEAEEVFLEEKAKFLDALEELQSATIPQSTHSQSSLSNTTAIVHNASRRKLPPIQVPTFSGKYSDWSSFKDLFTSLIVDDPELSNVERLQYLKSSLSEEAASLLKPPIIFTSENYNRAWEKLTSFYDNKRALIYACLSSFFRLASMESESHTALKQLKDGTSETIETLQMLKRPVDGMEDIIVFITVQRFDSHTRRDWELSLDDSSAPITWSQLNSFMKSRIQALERSEVNATTSDIAHKQKLLSSKKLQLKITSHVTAKKKSTCSYCQGDHYVAVCDKFHSLTQDKRFDFISEKQLCFNCLGSHCRRDCRSTKRCISCRGRHHTLLHKPQGDANPSSSSARQLNNDIAAQSTSAQSPRVSVHTVNTATPQPYRMLLATAVVIASSDNHRSTPVRVLIDPCSEASFVEESLAQRLKLSRRSAFIPVSGVGGAPCHTVRTQTSLFITPRFASQIKWKLNALVLPKLTEYLPSPQLFNVDLSFIAGLELADPNFNSSAPIGMILGADVFTRIIEEGLRKSKDENLVAQATGIGWILTGSWLSNAGPSNSHTELPPLTSLQCILDQDLSTQLERFWDQEEVPPLEPPMLTSEEAECEKHFVTTHKRASDGRYTLRLPFKQSTNQLGNSRQSALCLLRRTENRFKSQPEFRARYLNFMTEYEELGDMRLAPPEHGSDSTNSFFLPHHGIFKISGEEMKLRVVFNGSVKLQRGQHINECLHVGPRLQTEIFDIILRWRMHLYVFSTDIQKMFRQIQIDPADQPYQRILWRASEDQDVRVYNLTTVTYGLASSPYQAVRTLHQLAIDEGTRFPRAAKLLRDNTYVDDIFAGADTLEEAGDLKIELIELLKAGGFPLSKWSANHPLLLSNLKAEQVANSRHRTWQQFEEVQTLGISWQPTDDAFYFRAKSIRSEGLVTKRKCLSLIAQLYDPMGWITPVTIGFKIFMQTLWHVGLQWDDLLTSQLMESWTHLLERLNNLHLYTVPRWSGASHDVRFMELHSFSDASERAYAGCVYLRCLDRHGYVHTVLLASKSKVAPLKLISLPRLELCGALLAVRLVKRIKEGIGFKNSACHMWTDSTIALSWIRKHPSAWKTFVANRVSEIQISLPNACWHHIPGDKNPADLATRGISSQEMIVSPLWLHGPPQLTESSSPWPTSHSLHVSETCLESRTTTCLVVATPCQEIDLLNRYSSLNKLLRVTARCHQFIHNLRNQHSRIVSRNNSELTSIQLADALQFWVSYVQKLHFPEELRSLSNKKPLPSKTSLSRLNPFVDNNGILRVGGRLRHALLHPDEMHPMILPRQSYLTKLLTWDAHQKTLHGGVQLTLCYLRQRFWIVRGRQLVKSIIFKCLRCWRQRPSPAMQQMGDLPSRRVRRYRPFLHAGIDFAGPINLRLSKGRGTRSYKGYIAVFVCLSTRAVHLEVASGYSAEDFLQVYRRFVARRGICATISSDCGTNFVGANKELRILFQQASAQSREIAQLLANDGTRWLFNPPSAPHHGGIWEAAVKSVKYHLKRIVGETLLTFEEMSTLLTQIEACLNSRPLQPLSDDPSDLSALTPAHFLIGTSTLTIPEPSTLEMKGSRLSRWQLLRQMYDHFWSRWSSEYIHELQQRPKWRTSQPSVKVGDLCLIRSNLYPPCKWPLARIIEVKPGADGLVRVVHLRTATSTFVRPIQKISLLPREEEICSPESGEGGRNVPK